VARMKSGDGAAREQSFNHKQQLTITMKKKEIKSPTEERQGRGKTARVHRMRAREQGDTVFSVGFESQRIVEPLKGKEEQ